MAAFLRSLDTENVILLLQAASTHCAAAVTAVATPMAVIMVATPLKSTQPLPII